MNTRSPEDFAGYSGPSCSRTGGSQIVHVKHEVGTEETVWSKLELKGEVSLDEDDVHVESSDIPWQVYKNGKFIRHIWDAGGWNQSSMRASNVNCGVDSSSAMEQPMKLQTNLERITFEQTMETNVNADINSRSTVEQGVNPVTAGDLNGPAPDQLFYCELCESSFEDQHLMRRHSRNHMREKQNSCSVCGYSSMKKSHLARHMRTHTGEKPFKCTLCEYNCATKSDLTRHMRTHTGEKPFECALCEYKGSSAGNLTKHMRTHTGEKPYKCAFCEYKGSSARNLTKHRRTHTRV